MDDETVAIHAVDDDDPGAASEPPLELLVALWIPVFAVVSWFMVRVFSGRWITDPPQPLVPPPPPDDDLG